MRGPGAGLRGTAAAGARARARARIPGCGRRRIWVGAERWAAEWERGPKRCR